MLTEAKQNRSRFSVLRDEEGLHRPSPDCNVVEAREQLRKLEIKRRKLNSAIQQANFSYRLQFRDDTLTLNEALEMRKGLNESLENSTRKL